jgi:hypothetical protein
MINNINISDNPGKTARTNVGMVYLGKKAHLWRCHRVLFRKEQLEFENAILGAHIRDKVSHRRTLNRRTLERTAIWPLDSHIEIPQVVVMRSSRDSGRRVCHQTLRFLSCEGGLRTEEMYSGPHTLIIRCDSASVKMGYIGGLHRYTPSEEPWPRVQKMTNRGTVNGPSRVSVSVL